MKHCPDCGIKICSTSTRCMKCFNKKYNYCSKHISCSTISSWKRSAKHRKLNWKLNNQDLDEIFERQNGLCAISGQPLTPKRNDRNKISLDRIDPLKHYSKDNIQFVTSQVNYVKYELNTKDFIALITKIYTYNLGRIK